MGTVITCFAASCTICGAVCVNIAGDGRFGLTSGSSSSMSSSSNRDAANLAYKFAALDEDVLVAAAAAASSSSMDESITIGSPSSPLCLLAGGATVAQLSSEIDSIFRLSVFSLVILNGGSADFFSNKSANILLELTTFDCFAKVGSHESFSSGTITSLNPGNACSISSRGIFTTDAVTESVVSSSFLTMTVLATFAGAFVWRTTWAAWVPLNGANGGTGFQFKFDVSDSSFLGTTTVEITVLPC